MTDRMLKLIIGCLLHDIGKIIYRSGDGRNHSQVGYEFLSEETDIKDKDILNCIRYHHGINLKNADILPDDLSYIAYYADNIAAAADRRKNGDEEYGFDKFAPLESVFNILNNNNERKHYERQVLNIKNGINYPSDVPCIMDESFYKTIIANIRDNLKGIEISNDYINSLLTVMEANLSYIPSSTIKEELCDISLFDHVKITAAIASCVLQYMEENELNDFKELLFKNSRNSYGIKMFLLYSIDISGIQDFIYTISSKGALRGLRSRSFYLEILMEHIIDEILDKLGLSRANLIYSGGGHCYLLLPNTDKCKMIVAVCEKELNSWFIDNFDIALYAASGMAECSANDLENEPQGSYPQLYKAISAQISKKKIKRYDEEEIVRLNSRDHSGERECSICHRIDKLDEDDHCQICSALEKLSGGILYKKFFTVMSGRLPNSVILPYECSLVCDSEEELRIHMDSDRYIRSYSKNDLYTGAQMTSKLWVADYTTGDTFEGFAEKSGDLFKIGVLRADVDDLGSTFVKGFYRTDIKDKYVTLSRTAAFSRQMSLFFKCYLNSILENGGSDYFSGGGKRNVTVVYSGGDDLFLVGTWNEVIDSFIDIKNAFERFTQSTLTISGGIEIYDPGYPINIMAKETAELEENAKGLSGKDGICVFDASGTYKWKDFLNNVVGEKYKLLNEFFSISTERGTSFLYNILNLLRNNKEQIMAARYVYMLSRLEPSEDRPEAEKKAYKTFSKYMYEWASNETDRQELITAIYLYVYKNRKREVRE